MSNDQVKSFYDTWLEATNKFLASFGVNKPPEKQSGEEKTPPSFDWIPQSQEFFLKLTMFPPFQMFQGTSAPAVFDFKEYSELITLFSELYQEWMNFYLDFSKTIATVTSETNTKLMGLPLKGPLESYNIWIESMEKGIDNLLREPKTAGRLGTILSKTLDLKATYDLIMDRFFSSLNLPTKSEMKKVYKEIYLLKKELRKRNPNVSHRLRRARR